MNTLLTIINQPEKYEDFIRYNFQMAGDLRARLQILYFDNPDYYPFGTPGTTGTATTQVQRNLENKAENAVERMKEYISKSESRISANVAFDISTEITSLRSAVDKYISENKANMVVLKGQEDDGYLSQNNINIDIVRFIDCPAWIIPHNASYKPFDHIIYATDYKKEDIATMKKLIGLMSRFSPRITALHITDNLDFEEKIRKAGFLDTVQKKTSYDKISIKALVEQKDEDLAQLVNDFASDNQAGLIVVLKENRHFLERIFNPGSTKKIIKQARLPVLVFHEKD